MRAARRVGIGVLLLALAAVVASSCTRGDDPATRSAGTRKNSAPTVTISQPTTGGTYTTGETTVFLAGVASDDDAVVQVTWSNADASSSGQAMGTTSWSALVPVSPGQNSITITAHDARGHLGFASLKVTAYQGRVMVWGDNAYSQISAATQEGRATTPLPVLDPSDPTGFLTGAVKSAAGRMHTIVLIDDGTVKGWGWNFYGELGDGTDTYRDVPVQAVDPSDPTGLLQGVVDIAAELNQSVAVLADGTVRSWGSNYLFELGEGGLHVPRSLLPVPILESADPSDLLTNGRAIAEGLHQGFVVKNDGTIGAWGWNYSGEVGDGTTESREWAVPVLNPSDPTGQLTQVVHVSACSNTFAIRSDGSLWAWGSNNYGHLGDGTKESRLLPVRVVDPTDPSGYMNGVQDVAAGMFHAIAVLADGTVRSWGFNRWGQLGDGTTQDSPTPVVVRDPGDPPGNLTGVISVSAGWAHNLALLADGTVRSWGANHHGQLGDGSIENRLTPVTVVDPSDPSGILTGVSRIATGEVHSVAIQ